MGAVIGILATLVWLLDLSVGEIGVILVPMLAMAAVGGAGFLWAKRRGDF